MSSVLRWRTKNAKLKADPFLSILVSKKPGCHLLSSTPAAPPSIASPSELAPDQSNELCPQESKRRGVESGNAQANAMASRIWRQQRKAFPRER
ncbi:hypothetical protein PoB_003458100 [Plakobranchus ocellatus]|uniref:Uncharacterized protein n=1 Tax=Plakobranchus ocellatus TaxID=259542 RepID=A0AAV4AIC3_9GAST|nr:hypothetical protein PoB_003458100 [Plakobranchus ocellatus]